MLALEFQLKPNQEKLGFYIVAGFRPFEIRSTDVKEFYCLYS